MARPAPARRQAPRLTSAAAFATAGTMNILLVGSGGREHALAWKIAQSPRLTRLVCAPGNPGMAAQGEPRPIKATDVAGLVALAQEIAADLVVIGPEVRRRGRPGRRPGRGRNRLLRPHAAAGQLELSKAFTKAFCDRHGLPTAALWRVRAPAPAKAFLDRLRRPVCDQGRRPGRGQGRGHRPDRGARPRRHRRLLGGRFGAAGARVVIEEFLSRRDRPRCSPSATASGAAVRRRAGRQARLRRRPGPQHRRHGDLFAGAGAVRRGGRGQRARLIEPAFAGIAAEGAPYRGVIFCEIMVTAEGPKLVEFNARFGDPECQVLMLRLDSDLVPYLLAAATGRLAELPAPAGARRRRSAWSWPPAAIRRRRTPAR